jgi:DNA-binding GntR family transcriptional regulator
MADNSTAGSSAQNLAYRFIRDQILGGAYPGGLHVNPSKVADMLGISRMPVREALLQLDREGLVTARPNRGAVVTALSPEDVEELFEMRAALEALAAVRATPNLVGEAYHELMELKARMDRTRGNTKLWIQRHNEFHDFLATQSRRPRLTAEIARIRSAVQPYLLMYVSVYESLEMDGYEHDALIDAFTSRNLKLVERTMREHVLSAGRGVIAFLRERGPGALAAAR